MRGFAELLKRFHSDERGVFAVLFAVMAVVLIAMAGAVVDFTSIEQARTRAQQALDSAALGLQPIMYNAGETAATIKVKAEALLTERLNDASIVTAMATPTIDLTEGTLQLEATLTVTTSFVALVGIPTITATVVSQTKKGSINLEVAVALDTTGSMSGTRIAALKDAMDELIPLVVNDVQTPTYSKMAIVPYSMGVNVGGYATSVRGPIVAGKAITGAGWKNGASVNISGATRANPVVITTSSSHGYSTGDYVYISGISGMWQINNTIFRVVYVSATKYSLQTVGGSNVNGTSYNSYSSTSGDKSQRCYISTCEMVVTATGHGFATGDNIRIAAVGGTTEINNRTYAITNQTTDTFSLNGATGYSTTYSTYTSGGAAYCTVPGCEYHYFQSPNSNWNTFRVSTCATERTTDPWNDVAPSTTYLGRNYPSTGNPCIAQEILPLTSNKTTLSSAVAALNASGSTAGHTGIAWAWYLVSPNFASLFPSASQAASYTAPNTLKVVILMTDGEYNSSYCNGVISGDSTSGSGSTSDHINCNAPNGSSWSQSGSLCTAIKAAGVIVYTVGFDIDSAQSAQDLMANCATDASHAYTPNTGTELVAAFQDIGQNISALRVSR